MSSIRRYGKPTIIEKSNPPQGKKGTTDYKKLQEELKKIREANTVTEESLQVRITF